jgi:Uncharacterized protein conserved in bacteria
MRRSNIELLRIVLMLFIVMHHFIVHVSFRDLFYGDAVDLETNAAGLVNGFLYCAVNCFVLISGFFGIRFKWKGLANFYLILLFYGLIDLFASAVWGEEIITRGTLFSTILCFSHSRYWFIQCYLALYLMSPLLNRGFEKLTKQEFLVVIALFSIINLYLGYYWRGLKFNENGYTIAQFVYLYLIGAYIGKHVDVDVLVKKRWWSFMIYVLCSLLWGVITVHSRSTYIPHWYPWSYNNPFILFSALALFCFGLSFRFQSKVINTAAKGCLSVYILHCSAFLGETLLYNQVGFYSSWVYNQFGLFAEFVSLFFMALIVVGLILLIDGLRRFMMSPVWYCWDKTTSIIHKRFLLIEL